MSTLLDTNVVSELMRESPEPSVARWVSGHPVEDLFLSAVSEAELRYGATILPMARRRETLFFKMEAMLRDAFGDRASPSTAKPLALTATLPPRLPPPGVTASTRNSNTGPGKRRASSWESRSGRLARVAWQ